MGNLALSRIAKYDMYIKIFCDSYVCTLLIEIFSRIRTLGVAVQFGTLLVPNFTGHWPPNVHIIYVVKPIYFVCFYGKLKVES